MIIAIDPGLTTGFAILDFEFNKKPVVQTYEYFYDDVMEAIASYYLNQDDTIVIERFATSGRLSKYGLKTIELVGMIKGYCFARKIKYIEQTPQQREGYKKTAAEMHNVVSHSQHRIRSMHENDALAHLIRFTGVNTNDNANRTESERTNLS